MEKSIHQEICEAIKELFSRKRGKEAYMMTVELCQAVGEDAIRAIIERYLHEYTEILKKTGKSGC